MKILFCTTKSSPDYGMDTLFDGLCQLLGPENVYHYPHKPTLHGTLIKNLAWYPCFFNYPTQISDEKKVNLLKKNYFDIILVGCRRNKHYLSDTIFNLIKEKSSTIPVFLIDQDDYAGINTSLLNELNSQLYFKRECTNKDIKNPKIIPLSFSYSSKYMPKNIDGDRVNTLFWAGKVIPSRKPYVRICREQRGRPFYGFPQDRYRRHLIMHTIGLNLQGLGNDTVRYYEIPAHGTLLFTQKSEILVDNGFENGKTAVIFDSPEEMVKKLDFCLKNTAYTDKIRLAGHKWFNKHHTTKVRARQLIDKIKKSIS